MIVWHAVLGNSGSFTISSSWSLCELQSREFSSEKENSNRRSEKNLVTLHFDAHCRLGVGISEWKADVLPSILSPNASCLWSRMKRKLQMSQTQIASQRTHHCCLGEVHNHEATQNKFLVCQELLMFCISFFTHLLWSAVWAWRLSLRSSRTRSGVAASLCTDRTACRGPPPWSRPLPPGRLSPSASKF